MRFVAGAMRMPTLAASVKGFAIAVAIALQVATFSCSFDNPPQFSTAQAAHQHCPDDVVVWLNTNSGIYHFRGQRWYGRTTEGAYVCRREANDAGDRATRNGQ